MYLVYKPEGSAEPKRWKYQPNRLMSAEREMLERRTGLNFADFVKGAIQGSSVCRRALLHMYLKREHPTLRYEDVDFAWDELDLEFSKSELLEMRRDVMDSAPADQRDAILAKLDEEIDGAYEDPDDEGKAPLPSAG